MGLSDDEITDHYKRCAAVYDALGTLGGYKTIGLNDYWGWYIYEDDIMVEMDGSPHTEVGRAATFADDLTEILNRAERALYATTSYKDPDSISPKPTHFDEDRGERIWQDGSNPLPEYKDLRAVPVWADIDLADDVKSERESGLNPETKTTVEATLDAYLEEFATLIGGRDAVYALDSVGGAYAFTAPEATLPLVALADTDQEREILMQGFIDRSNEWLADVVERVNERIDGAESVIDPDLVNNKNRQYKAPMSLHTDMDAVVTPINTASPSYDYTPVEAVDEDLIEHTVGWADSLTAIDYRDRVTVLVEKLWPEYVDEYGDPKTAITQWVSEEIEKREEAAEQAQKVRARRRQRTRSTDREFEGPITPHVADVFDALDSLNIERVAEDTIVHRWTDQTSGYSDQSGDNRRAFIPIWGRNANSGNANFVSLRDGVWHDSGNGDTGGPVKMALVAKEGFPRDETPCGKDWTQGLEYLRQLGYEIPVWTPDAKSVSLDGDEYQIMPFWAVRKAALALDILPEKALSTRQTDSGETYQGFPGPKTYNRALRAIEDAGLTHNREYADVDDTADSPSHA